MDEADRAIIQRQLPNLLLCVQLTPEFLSQLQRLRVFSPDQLEVVRRVAEPRERCRQLLLDVTRRGPRAFDGLVRALLETGQLQAARLLKPNLSLQDAMLTGGGTLPTGAVHPPLEAAPPVVNAAAPPQPTRTDRSPCGAVSPQTWVTPVHPAVRPQPMDQAGDRPHSTPVTLKVRPAESYMGNECNAYKMTSTPRGLALVISNVDFQDETVHKKRHGGELDEQALPALLRELGFEVSVLQNLDRFKLRGAVADFVKRREHGMYDAAVLAILTHGHHGVLFGVDSLRLEVEQVIRYFSHDEAPLLAGKPKWLIFQACRGDESNMAHMPRDSLRQATDGRVITESPSALPAAPPPLAEFSDIFITYSTIPGYVSMRDVDEGTWLVQALCKVFAEHAHCHNLSELHTLVHQHMSTMTTTDNKMQTMEDVRRGWRKKLYFNPGL